MNEMILKSILGVPKHLPGGGQELIFPEIIAAMGECSCIHLPFLSNGYLYGVLKRYGYTVSVAHYNHPLPVSEVLYFGTPTIVNNTNLFQDEEVWDKRKERSVVRGLCKAAEKKGYLKIISGLGSGDILIDERLEDMGGGEVVCMKKFDSFTDWILVRNLI